MPQPLPITLHASAAETVGSGSAASVDITDTVARTLIELSVDVTAIDVSTTLTLFIETSLLGVSGWTTVAQLALTAQGSTLVFVPGCKRFVRARWTLAGGGATFAVTGTAHQIYAEPSDITDVSVPEVTLSAITVPDRARQCLRSSSEADDYLSGGYTLPLTAWPDSLRKHVANMAGYELLAKRGFDPDNPTDKILMTRQTQAISWLNTIQSGKHRPVGMLDTSPTSTETDVWIASENERGWLR